MEWARKDYVLTDDRKRIDVDAAHTLLRGTYWARTCSREALRLSIDNSPLAGPTSAAIALKR